MINDNNIPILSMSRDSFDKVRDLRAFIPFGVPMLAATASVTEAMREEIIEKLDMGGCCIVSVSPTRQTRQQHPSSSYPGLLPISEHVLCLVCPLPLQIVVTTLLEQII